MKPLPLLLILLIFASCTPQKRLERLIKHHPELLTKDTLNIRDTVITQSYHSDTMLILSQLKDTITIVKDHIITKLYLKSDTLYISNTIPSDTIYIEKKIPLEKIKYQKTTLIDKYQKLLPYIIIPFTLLIILAIIIFLRRR